MSVRSPARAMVNFVEGSKEPVFSNWEPARVRMDLVPVETTILDIRDLASTPTLDDEGFALVKHPVVGDWKDQGWIEAVYIPSCVELVKRMTAASAAAQIFFPLVRSSDPVGEGIAHAARFLHLDIPRDEYFKFAKMEADKAGLELDGREAAIFNVWKAISPPPQSTPLAVCRRRDIAEADHVVGLNDQDEHSSHFVAVKPPGRPMNMYYAPDLDIDESLVFIAADFNPDNPLGCGHQAVEPLGVSLPDPRTSIEVRILCIF